MECNLRGFLYLDTMMRNEELISVDENPRLLKKPWLVAALHLVDGKLKNTAASDKGVECLQQI